jgi:ABC-type proline/glycine betaine transport system permease subunit
LGEPIISGLNLNDYKTILQGAIPAALLALLVHFFSTDLSMSLPERSAAQTMKIADVDDRPGRIAFSKVL